jgi:hypothetical protein
MEPEKKKKNPMVTFHFLKRYQWSMKIKKNKKKKIQSETLSTELEN